MNEASVQPSGGNGKAIVLGILAMILGAAIWAAITVVTEHEFSLVAIGVGALVGLTMYAAKPSSSGIAVVAALLTVIGCALGEFLALPAYVARKEHVGFTKLLNYEASHLGGFFRALDGKTYVFWAIGAVAAFSMVFRRIQAARVTARHAAAHGPAPRQAYPPQSFGQAPQQPYAPQQEPYEAQEPQPYGPPPQQRPYGQGPRQYPPR
jgi:hypothetical protein